jgi:hypothetical protein
MLAYNGLILPILESDLDFTSSLNVLDLDGYLALINTGTTSPVMIPRKSVCISKMSDTAQQIIKKAVVLLKKYTDLSPQGYANILPVYTLTLLQRGI